MLQPTATQLSFSAGRLIRRTEIDVVNITDDEIQGLPDEPEERFIALERIVRDRYEAAASRLDENESAIPLQRRYMSIVLPAARVYGIDGLSEWERPASNSTDWQLYDKFFADVDYCVTELRLLSADRARQYSVELDAAAKLKLQHLVQEIRQTIDRLDVSMAKKEKLYTRLNALQAEIDRKRTKLEAFGALMIEASGDVGESAKRLEPLVRLVERVGVAIGIAKQTEDAQPRLPPRKERKQIGKSKSSKGPSEIKWDDEIPF
jgi:hypothetical protein